MKVSLLVGVVSATLMRGGSIASVDDLGTLGGSQAVAYRINDAGQAVGWMINGSGSSIGIVADATGAIRDLPAGSGGGNTVAWGINAYGVATGSFYRDGQTHGAIWSPGGPVIDL